MLLRIDSQESLCQRGNNIIAQFISSATLEVSNYLVGLPPNFREFKHFHFSEKNMPKHPFFPTKPQPFATFENGSHSFLRPGQTLALKEAIGAAREPGGMGFNLGVQGVPVSLEKIMAFNMTSLHERSKRGLSVPVQKFPYRRLRKMG